MSLKLYAINRISSTLKLTSIFRRYSKKSDESDGRSIYEIDEEGRKERTVYGEPYPDWRRPWAERDGEWYTKFRLFQQNKNPSPDILAVMQYLPDFDTTMLKNWWKNVKDLNEVQNQRFITERVEILGANLAAAHFITFRGGSIKLKSSNDWLKGDPTRDEIDLPNKYEDGYYIEAIDCSTMKKNGMRYEGLENLKELSFLKWLSLKDNKLIDDFCIDRLAGQNGEYLEYLDISGCSISENVIFAFARMTKLKVLVVTDQPENLKFQAGLSLLEQEYPNLLINCI